MKRLDAELKQCPDETTRANISGERDSVKNEIDALIATRAHYTQQISHTDKYLKDVSSRLDSLTKSRRNGEDSVYTEVDKIFQSIGANRAHYFGRAFEGVDIKKIMMIYSVLAERFDKNCYNIPPIRIKLLLSIRSVTM
jgi:hypothetical protein